MLFGPHCPYSRAEMQEIVDNMRTLGNIRFYVFTIASFPEMKSFYDFYQLKKYPNVTTGLDDNYYFGGYFKTNGVPYLAIYDAHKRLRQAILGTTPVSTIKDIAFE